MSGSNIFSRREMTRWGNIEWIIFVNVLVFVFINLAKILTFLIGGSVVTIEHTFKTIFGLNSNFSEVLYRPWTVLTTAFTHIDPSHILWNMLIFVLFARVFAAFFGDKRILPFYITAGLVGSASFLIASQFLPKICYGICVGASGAVTALMVATAVKFPTYPIHLMMIGSVKLAIVAIAALFLDFIAIANSQNTGGHIVHLGGAIFGACYMLALDRGYDLTAWVSWIIDQISSLYERLTKKKTVHKTVNFKAKADRPSQNPTASKPATGNQISQEQVDIILDKIKRAGYESLSSQEKATLTTFSNQK
jgi:membrane associated rhomboid family serine protease